MGRGHLTKSQSSIPKAEERHRISKTYFCHFFSFLKIFRSVNSKPNCSGDFSPLWSFETSFPILKLFHMCKEALSTWIHTLSFLQTEYNPSAPSVAQATFKSLQFFCLNLLSAMLGLQVWMTMSGPCLVMVFREGSGHWTETLFFFSHGYFSWKLSETSRRARWHRQMSWRQSCDRGQLSLAPLVGNFTARYFLHLHLRSPSSLLQALFPLPCAHSFVVTISSPSPVSGPCHLALHFLPVPHTFPWFHSQSQHVGPTFVILAAMNMCTVTDILAWGSPRFTQFHSKALFLTYW